MLPLSSRPLQGGKTETLQVRSLVVGMVIALASAGLGYTARGETAATRTDVLGSGQAASSDGTLPGQAPLAPGTAGPDGTAGAVVGGPSAVVDSDPVTPGIQPAPGGPAPGLTTDSGAPGGPGAPGRPGAQAPAPKQPGGQLSSGPLTASDQGVTKTGIKLGFLIANTSQLGAAGFKAGIAGDQQKIIKAWMAEFNRTGGVNGRKVSAVTQDFDVLSVDNMQAACKTMTRDEKVFSVITAGGYDSVAQLCIAKENKTPLISTDPEPEQWYAESKPYLYSTYMSKDRIARNKADWLKQGGWLRPTDKVGVIYHDIPNVAPSVEKSLLPALKRNGITPKTVIKLASDSNQALNQINNAVLQMRQDGVTFVSFQMNLIFKSQFMQVAENQNYFPRYDDSDVYFGCQNFVTAAYPARSFDKTQCLTGTLGGLQKTYTTNAFTKLADQVYKRTFPQGYATEGDGAEAQEGQRALNYGLGSEILLWHQAAVRAGTQLTRPLWGQAMQMTGEFTQQAQYCSMRFGPDKFDGADQLSVVQFRTEASDGYAARKFRTVRPCFRNYR